jgi:formate/nitrite transporter FocA (FNT family)
VAALGIVEGLLRAQFGHAAKIGGALAFGVSVPFLVVGRTELFNENFFDPAAAAVEDEDSWLVGPQLRLWVVTLAVNLAGGALLVGVLSVDGALPESATRALVRFAEDVAARPPTGGFSSAVVGGALVALLSYLLQAVHSVGSRITLAYAVGVFLALGPFDHVVVTVLHVAFGLLLGAQVDLVRFGTVAAVVTTGNLVGGLGLVTLTHVAQYVGAEEDDD